MPQATVAADPRARRVAAALCLLAAAALGLQLWLSLRLAIANGDGGWSGLATYLSYFTVLTNLLVATVAARAARSPDGGLDLPWRGCAVTAIVVVGVSYHLLLRTVWDPQGWQKVADIALHYAVPLAGLAWWLALPPRQPIAVVAPIRWLLWPLAYAVYALLRGQLIGTYPYYFIDVGALGMPRVLANSIGLALAFAAAGYLMRALAHWRQRAG